MSAPFEARSPNTSACFPKRTMRCHSVDSRRSSDSADLHRRVVAMRKFVTAWPFWVRRNSGSWPRWPRRITRLKLGMVVSLCLSFMGLFLAWLFGPRSGHEQRARGEIEVALDRKPKASARPTYLGEREVAELLLMADDEPEARVVAVPLKQVPGPDRIRAEELDPD